MSNLFISKIVGNGTYAIPTDDTELAAATDGLAAHIANLSASLLCDRVLAWVEDSGGPGGAEGERTLNCLLEKFTYGSEECPDEIETDAMIAAIEAELEGDANIDSVGQQQVHIFAGSSLLWQRDRTSGFLYPTTSTDDVVVGSYLAPAGKWFDDGDLVLGGSAMTGTEKLKVIGSALVDQNSDALGLDIDSEATGSPLINLQPVVGNTRGDIAFGVARTADPAAPSEGDLWYNSTSHEFKFYDGSATQILDSPWSESSGVIFPETYATDDVVVGSNAMAGDERMHVVGAVRVVKTDASNEHGFRVTLTGTHPVGATYHSVYIDLNLADVIGVKVDTPASGVRAVLTLVPNTSTGGQRCGTIRFGSVNNPAAPGESDIWYDSSNNRLRYHDDSATRDIAYSAEELWLDPGTPVYIQTKTSTNSVWIRQSLGGLGVGVAPDAGRVVNAYTTWGNAIPGCVYYARVNKSPGTSANAILYASTFDVSGGTITSAYHLYAYSPTGAGTFNRATGLYVGAQKSAAITTAYGVYQEGTSDLNVFAGRLAAGTTSFVGTERVVCAQAAAATDLVVDQNGDGVAIDIDSEATGNPLLNLQALNANSRGTIAFGTARTSDPSGPSEGDLWYNSTSHEPKVYNATRNRSLLPKIYKTYVMTTRGVAADSYYVGGFYMAPASSVTLNQGSSTQTYGSVNSPYGARAFMVAADAGSVDAGQVGLRVRGTSITTAGVRTPNDTDILTTDITTLSTDDYLQTSKRFIGQVQYELYVAGGVPTVYSVTFNYGLAAYETMNSKDFVITSFEAVDEGGASDSSFDVLLIKHQSTGWTYSAAAFVPGGNTLVQLTTDYGAESDIASGEPFSYRRTGLSTAIDADASGGFPEGYLVRVITGSSDAVQYLNCHVGVEF